MRKVGFAVTIVALLVSTVGTAAASLTQSEEPTLEPLADLIAAIEAGTAGDLVVAPGTGPIVNQFQVVVNLAENPTFFDRDIDVAPIGFDGSGELVDLAPFLGPNLELAGQVPPIAPSRPVVDIGGQPRFDLDEVFDGWEAFGEFGPIDGPVPAIATNTMLWGFELATPFDTGCGTAAAVGRAWESQSLVSANAPFDAAALDEWWPGTHTALADGSLGRLIQLNCPAGGSPAVETMRMNPDFGRIRPFGPLEIVALVKGNFVVFAGALRETEGHARDTTFFATGASGAVEPVEGAGPIPVLVPNPYDAVPQRIDFIYDVGSIEEIAADATSAPQDSNLLWRGDDGIRPTPIGLSCSLGLRMLYQSIDEARTAFWQAQTSTWRNLEEAADQIVSQATYPDGSRDELFMDFVDRTFNISVFQAPGSDQPDCRVAGILEIGGDLECTFDCPEDAADGDGAASGDTTGAGGASVDGSPGCVGDECTAGSGDGGSGTPWSWYGLAGAAGAGGALVWWRGRRPEPLTEDELAGLDRDANGDVLLGNRTFIPDDWPRGSEVRFDGQGRARVILPPTREHRAADQFSAGEAGEWYRREVARWEGGESSEIEVCRIGPDLRVVDYEWANDGEGDDAALIGSDRELVVQRAIRGADGNLEWVDVPSHPATDAIENALGTMRANGNVHLASPGDFDLPFEFERLSTGLQQSFMDARYELIFNEPPPSS